VFDGVLDITQLDLLLQMKLMDTFKSFLNNINNKTKRKDKRLGNVNIDSVFRILFLIALDGSVSSPPNSENKYITLFKKTQFEILLVQSYSLSYISSNVEHNRNFISLIMCLLYKNQKMPSFLGFYLYNVSQMFSARKLDRDWPGWAKIAWDGLVDPKDTLIEYEKTRDSKKKKK
jgi:hypothetical protein